MHDLVIRGGTLVDGTGAPARVGDLAVDLATGGGKIVAVGEVAGRGREEIDARGQLVTPGFVDMHTHYDAQVTWDPYLTPSSWHGCTTVVMGNCGVGFAPVRPDEHDFLIRLMEGVEDIPGAALHEGIQWGWETFPEYLDALARTPRVMDCAAQIPHGPLRAYVMGARGAANEPATAADIATMSRLVGEALAAGALGFSTSRTSLHRSADGELVPGTFAARDELFGIAGALRDAGHGVFQVAGEHADMGREVEWLKELALVTKRPVLFSMSQTDQAPDLWRDLVGKLEAAAAEGAELYGQVAGRAIGVLMAWQGTAHPFVGFPGHARLAQLPFAERLVALAAAREQLLGEKPTSLGAFGDFVTRSFAKMYPFRGELDYEPAPDASVAAIAERTGQSPEAVAFEALMANDGRGMIYFPLFNYSDSSLELLRTLHLHERTRMGLSDAGAHCGAICDGGMPTFMLTHWVRDRVRGERLPLERIIARQTRDTARTYGLRDRGVLAPGYRADVNVIDFDRLTLGAPEIVHDLPAGGRRLIQRARGYVATICDGVITTRADRPTGALPGKLVRGPQASPSQVRI